MLVEKEINSTGGNILLQKVCLFVRSATQLLTMLLAIGLIRRHPVRFESLEELEAIRGIGRKTALKVSKEFILLASNPHNE
jgi:hypothetical protein